MSKRTPSSEELLKLAAGLVTAVRPTLPKETVRFWNRQYRRAAQSNRRNAPHDDAPNRLKAKQAPSVRVHRHLGGD